MAVPNKLIAVDIFCSRLCVFILNSSWASSITKALETPSFRKSAELKRHFYQEFLYCGRKPPPGSS